MPFIFDNWLLVIGSLDVYEQGKSHGVSAKSSASGSYLGTVKRFYKTGGII